jgi:hypothetical protein
MSLGQSPLAGVALAACWLEGIRQGMETLCRPLWWLSLSRWVGLVDRTRSTLFRTS